MARAIFSQPSGKPHGPFVLGLIAAIAAGFWPVWQFEFVRWDDNINVTHNPLLTAPWSWSLVGQLFSGDQALRFKPLHWFFFRALHGFFGFDPHAWHAFNLILHVAAAALFYFVLVRVFERATPEANAARVRAFAALGAALWALHPLRAEAVAWVTASPYPLTTVNLLASFLCYLRNDEVRGTRGWLVASWLFAIAAYASYPVGITYGLFLIVVDQWLPLRAGKPEAGSTGATKWGGRGKYAAFLLPALLALGPTLWSRLVTPGIFTAAPNVEAVDAMTRWRMALASLSYLAGEFLWPVHLTPNLPPLVPADFASWGVLIRAIAALLVLGGLWTIRRRCPLTALVSFGFVALALPCLGWTERPTWPVDRYSYLVHLVLIGGIAGVALRWAERGEKRIPFAVSFGSAAVLVAGFFTQRQALTWRDNETLFSAMEQNPHFAENPRQQAHVYILWSYAEAEKGHAERFNVLFNRAQQVYLAAIRVAVGTSNYPEALALMTHLERYFPISAALHREKAAWLLRVERPAQALFELRAAEPELRDDPRWRSLRAEAENKMATASTPSALPR